MEEELQPKQSISISYSLQPNQEIRSLLIDVEHINMAYSYWKANKTSEHAVFEIFFRTNPFQSEFTIFAGLQQVVEFLQNFCFSAEDIRYLEKIFPGMEPKFFLFLKTLSAKDLNLCSCDEGCLVFPGEPLLRIEGPVIVGQLLEATLLNLIVSASLMVTNAARYRLAAGEKIELYEVGLKRDLVLDVGLTASKYYFMGGFDGTSTILAENLFNVDLTGTQTHSYITAFKCLDELKNTQLKSKKESFSHDLLKLAKWFRDDLTHTSSADLFNVNDGELAAFISFALAFPDSFNVLIDTYDVLKSGLINFCAVALALNFLDYRPVGIRIDSGDLAYLSSMTRDYFLHVAVAYFLPWFKGLSIMVSNNIREETISSLNTQKHSIDCFLINTLSETCHKQPTLDCVYKLVEINNTPRMMLARELSRTTIPGRKDLYRLYKKSGEPIIDVVQRYGEEPPKMNDRVLCRHPFDQFKRAFVTPYKVANLHKLYFSKGQIMQPLPSVSQIRKKIKSDLEALRPDIKRRLNPTPYKVSVSEDTYKFLRDLWYTNFSIVELS